MPLDIRSLESGLVGILDHQSGPRTLAEAANRWSSTYHSYASTAAAALLVPIGLVGSSIEARLAGGGDFFDALSSAIESYWMSATWAAPGFAGVTVSAGGLARALSGVGQELVASQSMTSREAASRLAVSMHNYTKAVSVAVTNVTTGVVVVATLE